MDIWKYLGIDTYGSEIKTKQNWEKRTIDVAQKYMWAGRKLSITGPDLVKLGTIAWKTVAIPSILFGCESLITTNKTIKKLEQIQSKFVKLLLNLHKNTPNICAQTETGLKPIQQILYYKQINYFYRVLHMNNQRWASQAMYEHIKNNSPYYKHIFDLKNELNITEHLPKKYLEMKLDAHFLTPINQYINQNNLPIIPLEEYEIHRTCKENTTIISQFRLKAEPTQNYIHTKDYTKECIPCYLNGIHKQNTGHHIFFECEQMTTFRNDNSMTSWLNTLKLKGYDEQTIFMRYLDGTNIENENLETTKIILQRNNYLKKWLNFTIHYGNLKYYNSDKSSCILFYPVFLIQWYMDTFTN